MEYKSWQGKDAGVGLGRLKVVLVKTLCQLKLERGFCVEVHLRIARRALEGAGSHLLSLKALDYGTGRSCAGP